MMQVSKFKALHMEQIFNDYHTINNKHCYEVAYQWCIVCLKSTAAIFRCYLAAVQHYVCS